MDGFRLTQINSRLSVYEKEGGQTFGADAFLLAAYTTSAPGSDAVDIGCGTGICSFLLADRKKARHIYAVDIQPELISAAKVNISENRLEETVTAVCTDVRFLTTGSFPSPVYTVISNPPYIPTADLATLTREVQHEPRLALDGGADGFEITRPLCEAADGYLNPGGLLALELCKGQPWPLARGLMEIGWQAEVKKDIFNIERFVFARKI